MYCVHCTDQNFGRVLFAGITKKEDNTNDNGVINDTG